MSNSARPEQAGTNSGCTRIILAEKTGMESGTEHPPTPPTGEALVRAALANERLIAATEEAYRRAEQGGPAFFPGRAPVEARPSDLVIEDADWEALHGLPPWQRAQTMLAIHNLLEDPHPNCVNKVALPPPFRRGTIALSAGGHLVTYSIKRTIENADVSWIRAIEPQADTLC